MTWAKVQAFIDKHSLPYRVERFNMSLRGVLVDAFTKDAVEYTASDAMRFLNGFAGAWVTARQEQGLGDLTPGSLAGALTPDV